MFKMGVNDDCVYKSNLTLNIFQEIFIKNEPDVKIDSFEVVFIFQFPIL